MSNTTFSLSAISEKAVQQKLKSLTKPYKPGKGINIREGQSFRIISDYAEHPIRQRDEDPVGMASVVTIEWENGTKQIYAMTTDGEKIAHDGIVSLYPEEYDKDLVTLLFRLCNHVCTKCGALDSIYLDNFMRCCDNCDYEEFAL